VISTFKNKGLKELFDTGESRRIAPALQKRIRVRLDRLNIAASLRDLNVPGFDFHPLRGKPQRYSIHVNGPWCLTFRWDGENAVEVDLEQYH
jgi:proteic killer suppression protein